MLSSCPKSSSFVLLRQHPLLPQAIPTPLFMSIGPVYKFFGTLFPILYFTSLWLFCNTDWYFLISLPLHSLPLTPHPSSKCPNTLCIHDSVSVLVCLVCFLDSIIDRYVFIAILWFIVLIFSFFLWKSF